MSNYNTVADGGNPHLPTQKPTHPVDSAPENFILGFLLFIFDINLNVACAAGSPLMMAVSVTVMCSMGTSVNMCEI